MNTWKKVMDYKNKETRTKGITNTLKKDEIETLLATIDFFGGNAQMAMFDLEVAKYRLFDLLAMSVMSKGGRIGSEEATKVLVYSYLKSKGDIDKFIQDLRETNYDIVDDWKKISLED